MQEEECCFAGTCRGHPIGHVALLTACALTVELYHSWLGLLLQLMIVSEMWDVVVTMFLKRCTKLLPAVQAFGKNPELMKSAAKMMQSMPKEQLQAALAQSGMAARMDPAMMSMATEAISKMPPEQLEQMAKMAASMQANMAVHASSSSCTTPQRAAVAGPAARTTSCVGIPAADAGAAVSSTSKANASSVAPAAASVGAQSGGADMSAMMTPEMMKMAADMMQNMQLEDMAAMQQMMEAAAPGGGMPPGAEQMMTPEMMKMAANMMKSMKPEDLAAMQQMMGAGGAPGSAGMPTAGGAGMPSNWTGQHLLAQHPIPRCCQPACMQNNCCSCAALLLQHIGGNCV